MASGIFPRAEDGGLRPNNGQPNNPTQAYDPALPPADTDALYYSNGCNARIRPHVLNSLISEIASTCDRAEVRYRYGSLQNLEYSVRYIVQRGLPRGAQMIGQHSRFLWDVNLDPSATRYNNFMTLTLVADRRNDDYVRMRLNGLPYVPLLRQNGEEMIGPIFNRAGAMVYPGDLIPGEPFQVAYWQGAFYLQNWLPDPPGIIEGAACVGCPGVIDMWPGEQSPEGAYECNGQVVPILGNERLFDIIGFRYGRAGDAHFRVPDLRGQFIRGFSNGSGLDPDASTRTDRGDGTIGDRVGTRQGDTFGRHTHELIRSGTSQPSGPPTGAALEQYLLDNFLELRNFTWYGPVANWSYDGLMGWLPEMPETKQAWWRHMSWDLARQRPGGQWITPGMMPNAGYHLGGSIDSGNVNYINRFAPVLPFGLGDGGGGGQTIDGIAISGGNETRPKNVALMFIIWR